MWELIPPATAFAYFVGKHMGPVAQAYFLQMIETNAKVKEMRLLHAAAQDLNQQPAIAKVEGGQVSVLPREGGPPAQASSLIAEIRREPARFAELPEARALDRLVHQEETRQSNLEGVLETAFEEAMADPDFAPGERRVDERWGNRFVEAASEASDEGARALWGRVLAGELKSPVPSRYVRWTSSATCLKVRPTCLNGSRKGGSSCPFPPSRFFPRTLMCPGTPQCYFVTRRMKGLKMIPTPCPSWNGTR